MAFGANTWVIFKFNLTQLRHLGNIYLYSNVNLIKKGYFVQLHGANQTRDYFLILNLALKIEIEVEQNCTLQIKCKFVANF